MNGNVLYVCFDNQQSDVSERKRKGNDRNKEQVWQLCANCLKGSSHVDVGYLIHFDSMTRKLDETSDF